MKRKMLSLVLVLVFLLSFTGCCFHSEWYAANCTDPKTCVECGETEGEALGHSWVDATCENPKTCSACNLTEGEALGHAWVDATTEAPKTCTTCSATEGERIITDERFTTAATAELQGTWSADISITGEMMGFDDFGASINVRITLEAGNDGTLAMGYALVNEEEYTAAMTTYLVDTLYAELAAAGLDQEAADAAMVEAYGMTVTEYVDTMMAELDLAAVYESMSLNGVYYVEGNQMFTGLSWDSELEASTFTLEGDTLTLDEELSELAEGPLVFTRVVE